MKEPGWNCVQDEVLGYTKCSPICGDKILVGSEACDDGNTKTGDGCTPKCTIEPGWDCVYNLNPAGTVCIPRCGDKLIVGKE